MPVSPKLLLQPVHLLAMGFGAGLVPRAPGTAGSLFALLPAWLMFSWPISWRIAIVIIVAGVGIWICGESARRLGVHDHPAIVLDEISAMLLLSLLIPQQIVWLPIALVLFRIFDIAKPWPIRDVDHRMRGGLGIMLDDLLAAAFAAVCLHIIHFFLAIA